MAIKIASFKIVSNDGKTTRSFLETIIATPEVIQISASNWEIAQALVFSAFGFDENLIMDLGYKVYADNRRPHQESLKLNYISPFPHGEVSRFWDTVEDEITLGRLELSNLPLFKSLIKILGLSDLLTRQPNQLSGGETAKVILASHLLRQPEVIVVDRILGEIDVHTRLSLINYIKTDCDDTLLVALDDAPLGKVNVYFDADQDPVRTMQSSTPVRTSQSLFNYREFEILFGSEGEESTKEYLLIDKLVVERAGRVLFDGVSIKAFSGSLLWVLGPNGSGKTTFFEVLLNFIIPTSGHVSLINDSSPINIVRNIAYSPQDPEADITELTLFKEVELARQSNKSSDAIAWLTTIGVDESLLYIPLIEDLSLRKLASVLAAIGRNKKVCLLDEPTLFLSDIYKSWVVNAMRIFLEIDGIILCATHDNNLFNLFCNMKANVNE